MCTAGAPRCLDIPFANDKVNHGTPAHPPISAHPTNRSGHHMQSSASYTYRRSTRNTVTHVRENTEERQCGKFTCEGATTGPIDLYRGTPPRPAAAAPVHPPGLLTVQVHRQQRREHRHLIGYVQPSHISPQTKRFPNVSPPKQGVRVWNNSKLPRQFLPKVLNAVRQSFPLPPLWQHVAAGSARSGRRRQPGVKNHVFSIVLSTYAI